MSGNIYILCSNGRCFEKWFWAPTLTDFWQTLFLFLHETEPITEYDHITLNFECQDGSSLQIFVQQEIWTAFHFIKLNFKLQTPFKFSYIKARLQPHVKRFTLVNNSQSLQILQTSRFY